MLIYHHVIDLKTLKYGEIRSSEKFCGDQYFLPAYKWLERTVGFYPLFLAVGGRLADIRMTGYDFQWKKRIGWNKEQGNVLRKAGEFPNFIMFSWEHVDGVFTDYLDWHIILNAPLDKNPNWEPADYERRMIFKPSFNRARWLHRTRTKPHTVQLVTSSLDLRTANRVWVRNRKTKKQLELMGFQNVRVKRIPCLKY